ncbi:hypothetical protein ONZ45_g16321 [Pleurotus djamor]|nr:hypothetical protein ONZ45_g16321 [Pleurotus djamor]
MSKSNRHYNSPVWASQAQRALLHKHLPRLQKTAPSTERDILRAALYREWEENWDMDPEVKKRISDFARFRKPACMKPPPSPRKPFLKSKSHVKSRGALDLLKECQRKSLSNGIPPAAKAFDVISLTSSEEDNDTPLASQVKNSDNGRWRTCTPLPPRRMSPSPEINIETPASTNSSISEHRVFATTKDKSPVQHYYDYAHNTLFSCVEVPGFDASDITVTFEEGKVLVTASAARRSRLSGIPTTQPSTSSISTMDEETSAYLLHERPCGNVERRFPVAPGVQAADIKATMRYGIVIIQSPIREQSRRVIPLASSH